MATNPPVPPSPSPSAAPTEAALALTALTAISPIDGRYASRVEPLRQHFSEYALIRNRVRVEVAWLVFLADRPDLEEIPQLSEAARANLTGLVEAFNPDAAAQVKALERVTRHDVKAVEYFLKQCVASNKELAAVSEFFHFACTSEDINNIAWARSLQEARETVMLPAMDRLISRLEQLSTELADVPMLSHTHGQPATPTTVGKELANTTYRLRRQRQQFAQVPIYGKFNGAVGNFSAHLAAFPDLDWRAISREFVESMGLVFNPLTTQIEPHDYVAELFSTLLRFNNILLDFDRDMWTYISLGYFAQKVLKGEVGSSTMPHKVNPIDFENSEGNIGLANAMFEFMIRKLPVSRMQRDLTDSTVLRNIGVGLAHTLIAILSTASGLNKVQVNTAALNADLDSHWELLAEPIQTVMRRYGKATPYESLKELTQGRVVSREDIHAFINEHCADLPTEARQRLLALTPATYLGNAADQARELSAMLNLPASL
eukprot:m.292954 g.292954  ORF g.292954 m.292954 type:complete len:489 (+) comp12703_c0_seq1:127-1593(+)